MLKPAAVARVTTFGIRSRRMSSYFKRENSRWRVKVSMMMLCLLLRWKLESPRLIIWWQPTMSPPSLMTAKPLPLKSTLRPTHQPLLHRHQLKHLSLWQSPFLRLLQLRLLLKLRHNSRKLLLSSRNNSSRWRLRRHQRRLPRRRLRHRRLRPRPSRSRLKTPNQP